MQRSSKKKYVVIICFLLIFFLVGCNQGNASDELEIINMETETEIEAEMETETEGETAVEGSSEVEESDTTADVIEDVEDMQVAINEYSVYVCGAVMEAGVYQLAEGSRICDALVAAGGMTEDAMETYLNQAELLVDGQMIYVPTQEEAENQDWTSTTSAGASTGASTGENQESSGLVNINTASKEELMTLTGIGEAKAESIIDYRETNGFFSSIEDIQNITGIKEGVFTQIEDEITT